MARQLKLAGARSGATLVRSIESSGDWVSQLLLLTAVVAAVVGGAIAL